MADDDRVGTHVETRRLALLFGAQRIDDKLVVGRTLGTLFVEAGLHPEELGGGDSDVAVEEWQELYLHRKAVGPEHVGLTLILDDHIIDYEPIEEP